MNVIPVLFDRSSMNCDGRLNLLRFGPISGGHLEARLL